MRAPLAQSKNARAGVPVHDWVDDGHPDNGNFGERGE
jgi:hypothetical protein